MKTQLIICLLSEASTSDVLSCWDKTLKTNMQSYMNHSTESIYLIFVCEVFYSSRRVADNVRSATFPIIFFNLMAGGALVCF